MRACVYESAGTRCVRVTVKVRSQGIAPPIQTSGDMVNELHTTTDAIVGRSAYPQPNRQLQPPHITTKTPQNHIGIMHPPVCGA